ncbi:MAG: recombinase family protein, partial [Clostridia bacterium]
TENRDSGTMEMMPIMNVFNEWHAANTSKKIRTVRRANAKEGIYTANKASYGYKMGTDKKRAPVIDEETAPIVRRIFEMYASGKSPSKIAEVLNLEGIASPATYAYAQTGKKPKPNVMGLWTAVSIREMLNKIIYIGHMPQLCWTSMSYKNHKRFRKDESEWSIVYNNHEPIISQELWDKVQDRKKSVATGRKTKVGYTHPLSGFLYCADCGNKMKFCTTVRRNGKRFFNFDCGYHIRYGKAYCFSHYISASVLEEIVLEDIRGMAKRIVLDEKAIREEFIRHNAELADEAIKAVKKDLQAKQKRVAELPRLMQVAYEDRVKGKMPENICISFIQKYSDEQNKLETEIAELESRLNETTNTIQSADCFICNVKKYLEAPELTREMCYELIDRIIVSGPATTTGKEREIDIVYKVDIASVLRHKLKK